jgi:DASS family divalent anion:Na+ symporter
MKNESLIAEHAALLARVELFGGLARVTLAKLAAHLVPVRLTSGAELFHQGDPGDAFYLIARGELGVYVAGGEDEDEKRVAVLGAGDPVGEMALLTSSPRSATIRAETDGDLLRLDRARFLSLMRQEPEVALAIAATLSRRLQGVLARGERRAADSKIEPSGRIAQTTSSPASHAKLQRLRSPGILSMLAAGVILFSGWLSAPVEGLSPAGWHALVLLAAVVPMLAVEALPEGVLALLLAAAWVLGGVAGPEVTLTGFSSASWVLVVSVLAVGSAIAASGVLYRLALWTVAHTRGGFRSQVIALSIVGVLMGPAVPNATSRVTITAPALKELVEALGYAPGSSAAAGLSMAALIGFGQMAAVFLTSSTTAVLVFAVLPPESRSGLDWIAWAYYAAPPHLILLAGFVGTILWWYRPQERIAQVRGSLELQRALLGPPSWRERISLVIGAALVVGFISQPFHGVDSAWLAVLALTLLAATGVVTAATLREVNWSFALLFGMLASISNVFSVTRVDRWLAHTIAGAVGDLTASPALFVFALTLLCFVVSLVLRWQAAAPLMTIALGPAAAEADISPLVVGLVALIACNSFFMPYQSTTYLALYQGTGGELFSHRQARAAALAYGLLSLLALTASVFFWDLMGLL